MTCSVAFERSGSGERGVVAADLRLAWLDGLLREVQVSPGGFAVLLTRDGRVIAHSIDGGENASREVLVRPDDEARRRLAPVVDAMLAGPEGFQRVRIEGEPEWLSFRRVAHVGWWLAELYPESEMLAGVARLRSSQVGFSLMGLILLAAAVALVSRRLTRGLASLAASADRIAAGDLETEVPTLSSHDEIGVLTRAFAGMRRALLAYLEDLRIATVAKERLEGELRTARRIQEDMLSSQWAGGTDQGFELSAVLQPARQVGGDLYYHLQEGRRLFFLVGDVSGKGIAAALFMARAKTVFETIAPREEDPGSILTAVNAALCRGNEAGMFVTAACGWLDLRTGGLTVALAGHERPIVVRGDGAVAPLDVDGGPVLGLMEDSRFPVGQGLLAAGDAVVTFTDGISDAQSEEGEFFGTDRLIAALGATRQSDALGITSAALAAVKEFSTGAPQFDDMTVMAVRFLAPLS